MARQLPLLASLEVSSRRRLGAADNDTTLVTSKFETTERKIVIEAIGSLLYVYCLHSIFRSD